MLQRGKGPHVWSDLDFGLKREKQMISEFFGVFAALLVFANDEDFEFGAQNGSTSDCFSRHVERMSESCGGINRVKTLIFTPPLAADVGRRFPWDKCPILRLLTSAATIFKRVLG